jgi:mono/diheme cytochrome c family protein
MRINPITRWVGMSVALAIFASGPAQAENFERGQELYGNQCGECHNKLVPLNKNDKIKTLSKLRERIASWAAHTGAEWGDSELDDVSYYLNKSFYHFTDKKL